MFIKALRISDTGVETRLIATTTLDGGGGNYGFLSLLLRNKPFVVIL